MKIDRNAVINWILVVTIGTLALVVLAVVGVSLYGLFDHSVDNEKLFEIIGPAFSTVIGAFVGLIGGISLSRDN